MTDAAVAPSGERRQVTALFADMVGFTAISERLGEEGTFALIQPIYDLMLSLATESWRSSASPMRWRTAFPELRPLGLQIDNVPDHLFGTTPEENKNILGKQKKIHNEH